jgi:HAD superfamily hydrolase (TIGR01509 family)
MRDILGNADTVLFDFDGPICSLFAVHSAADVAQRLLSVATAHRTPVLTSEDPHAVLRAVTRQQPGSQLARLLERTLAQEEIRAAATARPTPYAADLITALAARGRRLAVASNNSPLAVASYLTRQQLAEYFHGQLHGRTGEVALLKPDPDCVHRALRSTGTPADRALMIGDTPTDLAAARAAGVPFLGYARDRAGAADLHASGARHVATSLGKVLKAVTAPSFG